MKNKHYFIYFLVGFIVIFLFFGVLELLFHEDQGTIDETMNKLGYQVTDENNAFYKKNITDITIEQYYSDMAKKKNSEFNEFSIAKDSLDFIEQKLKYFNGNNYAFNISSNLTDKKILFQYEYSYNDKFLMLEGNSINNYQCKVIEQKNITKTELLSHCDMIKQELQIYIENREELLKDSMIKKIIKRK